MVIMKKNKKILTCLGAVFLILSAIPAFAIDAYVTVIYRKVDIAFVNKSDADLNVILSENNTDRNYYLVENYTMKKIRRLIIDEDYNFAMKADLVVIDNNLENMEAVDLYATISEALEKQKEQERAIEERRQYELARFQAEKEKQKAVLVKSYETVQTPEGDTVYSRSKDEKYTASWWNIRFGMFDGTFVTDTDNSYNSFRYGISGDFTYEYTFDTFHIGIDAGGQAVLLPFSGDDKTMLGDFEVVPKLGFTKHLQFRAGFAGILRMNGGDETTLHESLFSPVFGLGLHHVNIGKAVFSGHADYLLGHLATDDLKAAARGGLNLAMPIAEMEKVKVTFNMGLTDTLYVKESGIENRAGVILAIGAENVIK